MKKVLLIMILFLIPFNAFALEIKDLGLKADEIKEFNIYTRDTYENVQLLKQNDIFAIADDDNYSLYIRAIKNPGIVDYEVDKDLVDEVFSLINKVNTSKYSYIQHKKYKWIRFDYVDKNNKPILEYFLSWKNIYFTITFVGKYEEIPFEMKNKVDKFVESIDISGKGAVPVNNIYLSGLDYFKDKKEEKDNSVIVLVILCLCSIGIAWCLTRKKR